MWGAGTVSTVPDAPTPAPASPKGKRAPASEIYRWVWLLSILAMIAWNLWLVNVAGGETRPRFSYSEFVERVRAGEVASVVISGQPAEGTFVRPMSRGQPGQPR